MSLLAIPQNSDNPARRQFPLVPAAFAPGEIGRLAAELNARWVPPRELTGAWSRLGITPAPPRPDHWPLRLLQLEVVNACNFRCPLCSTLDHDGVTRRRMTLDEFKQVVGPAENDLLGVALYGNRGEPLLNAELPAMIAHLKTHTRALTSISTNGSRVTAESAHALMEAGLTQLIFAIDGISDASYSAYRVGGNLESVLANLKTACELKRRHGFHTRIVWQFIPMATNEHEIDDVGRVGYELGVDEVRCKLSRSASRSVTFRPSEQRDRPVDVVAENDFDCPYGLDRFYVDPNGDCYPCCYGEGKGLLAGNALEMPLDKIWQSEAMWTLRRSFLRQQDFHPFCSATCNQGYRREAAPNVILAKT